VRNELIFFLILKYSKERNQIWMLFPFERLRKWTTEPVLLHGFWTYRLRRRNYFS